MKLNHLVFELVEIEETTGLVIPVKTIHLVVMPRQISYIYPTRTAIEQTLGGGFKDEFGLGLPRITISGYFGYMPRRVGLWLKHGWERLREFREDVFKASHRTDSLYGLNFYDYVNDEKLNVNLDQFQVQESTDRNNLPVYNLTMTAIGDVIKSQVDDPILSSITKAENLLDDIQATFANIKDQLERTTVLDDYLTIKEAFEESLTEGIQVANTYYNMLSATVRDTTVTMQRRAVKAIRVVKDIKNPLESLKAALEMLDSSITPPMLDEAGSSTPLDLTTIRIITQLKKAASETEESILALENMDRFLKTSPDKLDEVLRARASGSDKILVKTTKTYTVGNRETIQKIAQDYGVSWREILEYNNLSPLDIETGVELKIPLTEELFIVDDDYPVFGDLEGVNILGQDLTTDFGADEDGDLRTLSPSDTFIQGLECLLETQPGDLAGHPSWGFRIPGTDLPQEVSGEFDGVKVEETLYQDVRVEEVESVSVTREDRSLRIIARVKPRGAYTIEELTANVS